MKLRWTEQAQTEFDEAFAYLDARRPHAADAMRAATQTALAHLSAFPRAGAEGPRPHTRSWPLGRWKKRIVYAVIGGDLVVLSFRDGRRRDA